METTHVLALGLLGILTLSLLGALLSRSAALRNATVWVLIFGGVMYGAGVWDDVSYRFGGQQASFLEGGRIEVPRGRDGHYSLTLQINGVDVDFMIDTGASQMVLTQQDAARVGLDPAKLAFIGTAYTANGAVRTAPVRLDTVDLGGIRDTRVRASVNGGDMTGSLLGMSYLNRFQSIEIRGDRLILTR